MVINAHVESEVLSVEPKKCDRIIPEVLIRLSVLYVMVVTQIVFLETGLVAESRRVSSYLCKFVGFIIEHDGASTVFVFMRRYFEECDIVFVCKFVVFCGQIWRGALVKVAVQNSSQNMLCCL